MRYKVKPKADLDLDLQANFFAREASLQVALRFFDAADVHGSRSLRKLLRREGLE